MLAGAPGAGYRLRKHARRHKMGLGVAAAMVVLLFAGIAATSWQAVRATDAARLARDEADRATAEAKRANEAKALAKQRLGEAELAREEAMNISEFLTGMFRNARPGKKDAGRDLKVADVLDQAAENLRTGLADQPERRFKLQMTIAGTYMTLDLHDKAAPLLKDVQISLADCMARRIPRRFHRWDCFSLRIICAVRKLKRWHCRGRC